ncbi:uncharacterized protein LOC130784377 isoform X2 [Actinidia eriantha]|uniref:uncharacterized protein LOC130784377 isoform X2 n=1 Tax=Actinidia eriantha TaxID=165200 RepID=UPI00258D9798|nr:uncharacterized protein LOC130784377 isoform X2 [Actinidia eriantha]
MAVTMHAKSDSEVTSIDASSPPRSPRRPLYYVQSPSQHDVEKMSYGSTPFGSPVHHHYHCSPIHHSRESSTSRFSASGLKHHPAAWKRLQRLPHDGANDEDDDDDDDSDDAGGGGQVMRFYVGMVFHNFNIQAGMDQTGVPTDMLTLNSTVRILYRNPATFFGVHVTSTPVELHYYQLKVATGYIKKFYQSRKSQRMIVTEVLGNQVPLYGGIPRLSGAKDRLESVSVPLNLTFLVRSRAYILGRLVKPKFYRNITCEVILEGNRLGKHHNLANSCIYKV